MPKYKVVFRNGENKKTGEELTVSAIKIETANQVMFFVRKGPPDKMFSAIIPLERILYIEEIDQG